MTDTIMTKPSRIPWRRLVLLVPFVWQLGLAGVVNGIPWRPLGMTFQMAWQMAGVLVASASIAFVFWRDEVEARRVAASRDLA